MLSETMQNSIFPSEHPIVVPIRSNSFAPERPYAAATTAPPDHRHATLRTHKVDVRDDDSASSRKKAKLCQRGNHDSTAVEDLTDDIDPDLFGWEDISYALGIGSDDLPVTDEHAEETKINLGPDPSIIIPRTQLVVQVTVPDFGQHDLTPKAEALTEESKGMTSVCDSLLRELIQLSSSFPALNQQFQTVVCNHLRAAKAQLGAQRSSQPSTTIKVEVMMEGESPPKWHPSLGPGAGLKYMTAPCEPGFTGCFDDLNVTKVMTIGSLAYFWYSEQRELHSSVHASTFIPGELWRDPSNDQVWLFPSMSPSELMDYVGLGQGSKQHYTEVLKWRPPLKPARRSHKGWRGHLHELGTCQHFVRLA